jgi:hypothetical protein
VSRPLPARAGDALRRALPRHPGARAIVVVVAFFAVLNAIVLLVSSLRPEPGGATGSAYATQPAGAAAYAELLRRDGHRVRYLRTALGHAPLDPAQTVVVLDPPRLSGRERAALARFVRAGGRLVAGGEDAGRGIVARPPVWAPDGPRLARPVVAVAETSGVRDVASAGDGGFLSPGGARAVLGAPRALLAVARAGRGRALLLADASPLQNALLDHADNAALGLALAGPRGRSVTFVESVHGFGARSGLAALPARWRFALAIVVLAALLWLASRARRFGPPEETAAAPPPPRREHVEALAIALRRARDPATALASVRAEARAQAIRRGALAPDVEDDALRAAALRLGFEDDEAAALTAGPGGAGDDTMALGRALARGRR